MIMHTLIAMTLGLVLNMMLGKPKLFLSLEDLILSTAKKIENSFKSKYKETSEAQRMAGGMVMFFVLLIFSGIPLVLIVLSYLFVPAIGIIIETLLFWFSINIKNTRTKAMAIMRSVRAGNLPNAQKKLSQMTGLDCSEMSMEQVIKTTIEKISDRCVNGGFSPIFYMTILGGFGAMFYKTLCLLNGEVVKNKEEYIDFGKNVRTLWNILGFIPSRIGSSLLMLDVNILSLNKANAKKVHNRDHTHAIPKFLGEARSVIAGALGIKLNSYEYYDGMFMRNRSIGQPIKPCEPNDIFWATQLFYGSVFSFFLLFALIRFALFFIF